MALFSEVLYLNNNYFEAPVQFVQGNYPGSLFVLLKSTDLKLVLRRTPLANLFNTLTFENQTINSYLVTGVK